MFYMDRGAKVSTVTPSSDLPLRGHRSKKGQISKIIDMHGLSSNLIVMIPVTLYVRKNTLNFIRDPGVKL